MLFLGKVSGMAVAEESKRKNILQKNSKIS